MGLEVRPDHHHDYSKVCSASFVVGLASRILHVVFMAACPRSYTEIDNKLCENFEICINTRSRLVRTRKLKVTFSASKSVTASAAWSEQASENEREREKIRTLFRLVADAAQDIRSVFKKASKRAASRVPPNECLIIEPSVLRAPYHAR